jgi:hypothetical protein
VTAVAPWGGAVPADPDGLDAALRVFADRAGHALAVLATGALRGWARPSLRMARRVADVLAMLEPSDPPPDVWARDVWCRR